MSPRNRRNVLFISLSQFGIAFSFNFVMVFLPFLIHDVSHYSPQDTLIWVGFILGGPSFAAALASTFWGSLTPRFGPKTLFIGGLISHTAIILLMGFVSQLPVLLALRIIQGIFGGISTVGLVIVSGSSSREWVSTVLAYSNLNGIYLIIGSMGILALAGYALSFWSARNLTS